MSPLGTWVVKPWPPQRSREDMTGFTEMTDQDRSELFDPLTKFLEDEGWGVELWPSENEPWGIRAFYPKGTRHRDTKAQINIHTNRTFAWLDHWGRPRVSSREIPSGTGWLSQSP